MATTKKSTASKPATSAPAAAVPNPGDPDAAATSGGAAIAEPKGSTKVQAAHIAPALDGMAGIGAKSASALASELAGMDFIATPEDEAAKAIEAAYQKVTGEGRLNRDQAIIVARRLRAATS